ncbi:hypothetical protein [Pseudobacteriovorax antillogorgiicola]|uniref:Phosphoglycerol transferase MdoB n=1 Tax=Pseudobacteriovorax antillogorgiicola TaxID=1513793 RepID=A0A1Y6C2X6_9BACT|nr:hypothetical protein [Pseudobacteriovorax antillogorgiicola]TCS49813.1 phosphoglycerol transferase MdoB-like AlkP superfamily enzyme [Pseudobacteriovorax antillogorgiicola]SMF43125.1 Phosphoglycerol transferase MdoB [Pseudobacteriovorax antillogorgiicola]
MKNLRIIIVLYLFHLSGLAWDELSWGTLFIPNYDTAWLLLLAGFIPALIPLASVIIFISMLLNIGDGLLVYFMNRKLYLGLDWLLIRNFFQYLEMNYGSASYLIILGLCIVLGLLLYGSFVLLRNLRDDLAGLKRSTLACLAFAILIAGHEIHHCCYPNKSMIERQLAKALRSFSHRETLLGFSESLAVQKAKTEPLLANHQLPRKPQIFIFILESYGLNAFDLSQELEKRWSQLGEQFRHRAYHYGSGVIASPVFGGQSWMAFASINCGVFVDNQIKFKAVFRSSLLCLPHLFNRHGYHTMEVKPGTKFGLLAEEKETYKFQSSVIAEDLGYRGPYFGWGGIPDEYTIRYVFDHIISKKEDKKPWFVEFFLLASHTPWNGRLPLFGTRLDILEHHGTGLKKSFWQPESKVDDAYIASLIYDLDVISFAIENYLSQDDLVIVLGDHPPHGVIPSKRVGNFVPLHIISPFPLSNSTFLGDGLIPSSKSSVLAAEGFPQFLIELLSTPLQTSSLSERSSGM